MGLAIDSSKASQLASLRWCPLYGSVGLSAANAHLGPASRLSQRGPLHGPVGPSVITQGPGLSTMMPSVRISWPFRSQRPSGASQSASTTGPYPWTSWPISDYPRASQPASQRWCPHHETDGLFIASDTEGLASRPLNDKGPLHGPHCKKNHVGMRKIPMLTTVAQNQTTWE
jgi:hypothetical protein